MAITDYSTTRDSNASIAPGDLRSNDYRRDQQIINAIRQLMADLAAMQSGGVNGIEKITIVRNGAETVQYFELGLSEAAGHLITSYSAANNAKGFIFNTRTDTSDTAPSAGENGFSFQIRSVEKFKIDDGSDTSYFRQVLEVQNSSAVRLIQFASGGSTNAGMELGRADNVSSTPYIDFHSGATSVDYDARIIASGGTGSNGGGALDIYADAGVNLIHGKLEFPATQDPSTNVNILDDYEEGTWTPVLTFATPGNLSVAYTTQLGRYQKVGNHVHVTFIVVTSTFTHTTASGECRITGLPFTSFTTGSHNWSGATEWGNVITPPGARTQVNMQCVNNVTYLRPVASGPGVSRTVLSPADMPTGNVVVFIGTLTYEATS